MCQGYWYIFEDESIEVIIADLSLHYFNDETTKNIVKEIKRVLKCNGYLIARVNSVNDSNFISEAFGALISFFFEKMNVNRIEAKHDLNKPSSGKVIEKCGLIKEDIIYNVHRNVNLLENDMC